MKKERMNERKDKRMNEERKDERMNEERKDERMNERMNEYLHVTLILQTLQWTWHISSTRSVTSTVV